MSSISTNNHNTHGNGIVVNGDESVAVICGNLRKCLELRERYMLASGQLTNPKDNWTLEDIERTGHNCSLEEAGLSGDGRTEYRWGEDGIYRTVPDSPSDAIPSVEQYYSDVETITQLSADGPTKTFAFRRLRLLSAHFQMHLLQNEQAERHAQKAVPHRDFYNVRKIDTHVHHSSCMNSKHLLRFIKGKLRKCPDDVVIFRDSKYLTLQQVFDSLNLTPYDLSIDSLDMHAHKDAFHRFDRFNLKYNPLGRYMHQVVNLHRAK